MADMRSTPMFLCSKGKFSVHIMQISLCSGIQSDKLTSHNMYERFIFARYMRACLKKISHRFEP